MNFGSFDPESRFRAAWQAVRIHRKVPYSLFTFGESELDYFLVESAAQPGTPVELSRGQVRVTRPLIITPDNAAPELRNVFDAEDGEENLGALASFLLARTAAFSHLRIDNRTSRKEFVSDSVEEVVARLDRQLDRDDEDRVAILSAPHGLGGMAILRYTTQRIMDSAPGNIQELREKGFLPDGDL